MQPFIIILIFCFLVFLFCVYIFSHDDFVFLRKNISMERVFNLAFLTAFSGLFFARFFYVLFNFHLGFLNPIVFFLFTYFLGLSLAGGVVGGAIFLLLFASSRKLPKARLFDVFSLSFAFALSLGLFINFFLRQRIIFSLDLIAPIIYIAFFIASTRMFLRAKLKDGSLGTLFILVFSLVLFAAGRIKAQNLLLLSNEDFILIEMFLLSLVFLLKQEELFVKKRA